MSEPVRIALIGMGKMGRAIATLAPDRDCAVVATLDVTDTRNGISRAQLNDAQVAIDFTQPDAAVANAMACMDAGCAVVIGTTGWQSELQSLGAACRRTAGKALWSPNFSLGVQLFLAIAEDAGRRLRAIGNLGAQFDMHLVETHHTAKKDAPSGTAIAIADRLTNGHGGTLPVTSVRVGQVPGTHEVIIDGAFEQLVFRHEARDRRVFADGALSAAKWLAHVQAPGLYTMRDMIGDLEQGA